MPCSSRVRVREVCSFCFLSSTINNLCLSLWELERWKKKPNQICFGTLSSEKHRGGGCPVVIGNLLLWFWKGSHVYITSCDEGVQTNFELSAPLLSNRRCFLSRLCVFVQLCSCVLLRVQEEWRMETERVKQGMRARAKSHVYRD